MVEAGQDNMARITDGSQCSEVHRNHGVAGIRQVLTQEVAR